MGIKNLTVKSDSQLIVGQVKGKYEKILDSRPDFVLTLQKGRVLSNSKGRKCRC